MKKIWILIIAVLVLVGGGYWSVRAGVWKNVVTKRSDAISYRGQQGKSALEILKSKYRVETQVFTGGEFVKTIDGKTTDNNTYWAFKVNGKDSPIGAGQYVTQDSDTIEWEIRTVNTGL